MVLFTRLKMAQKQENEEGESKVDCNQLINTLQNRRLNQNAYLNGEHFSQQIVWAFGMR